nr:MAG TPA: hypothetical protein [Bacteriophage sp.]
MKFFERTLVQLSTLPLSQHHYVHLVLSYKHRLYLIHIAFCDLGETTSIRLNVLPSRGIVVEPSLSCLDADYPLLTVLRI